MKVQYPKGLEEFTYDKADNRIRRLTEKEEELYRYDVCNRLTEKQTRRLSDNTAATAMKHGNGMNPENAGKAINLEKPESMKPQGNNGTVKSLSVGDQLTTHYEYDSDKNLTRQWTKMQGSVSRDKRERFQIPAMDSENQTLLADYHYSYDGNGNRISREGLI